MSNLRDRCSLLTSGVLACTLLVASLAHASGVSPGDATAVQKKEAMGHFTVGKQAAEAKNWEKAFTELRASLEIVDSPNARLVLARALRDAGQLGAAWAEYGRTIDEATKLTDAGGNYAMARDSARTERGEFKDKLAFVTVGVEHAPPDATLKVGGRVIPPEAWSAPIVVSPGAVDVVVADSTGKELARQTVGAVVGDKTPVALDAQPPVVAAPAAPPPDHVPPADTVGEGDGDGKSDVTPTAGRSGLRPYSYVAGGVGAAGLIVFGIFGAMERSTYSGLQSSCPGNVCPPGKSGDVSSGKTQELVANVGLGVGIVGVAAGVTLFALSFGGKASASPQAASTSLVLSPGFIGLRGAL